MSGTAHIRQFGDDSLEHRVQEYHLAREGYENVLRSKQLANDPEWSDTLGEQEDIDIAEEIMKTSLSLATGAIGLGEIADIIELGLMTEEETQRLSEEKQKQEFKEKLQAQRQSNSDEDEQQM
jgi:hypothetical protein